MNILSKDQTYRLAERNFVRFDVGSFGVDPFSREFVFDMHEMATIVRDLFDFGCYPFFVPGPIPEKPDSVVVLACVYHGQN